MTWTEFREWRTRMGLTQVEAGKLLGRERTMISHYEGGLFPIPPAIELACAELERQATERRAAP